NDARTSICHCKNCKKAFRTNCGLTTKVPKDSFALLTGVPKEHVADNGSGTVIHREFCDSCGSFILEYGEPVKDKFRYIVAGSSEDPDALPPKSELFYESRTSRMPEILSTSGSAHADTDVFHKEEVKE
ncbi:DUF636 domain protein, partial [Peniophora sp. CONT]